MTRCSAPGASGASGARRLIAVVGPTAAGKTQLAIAVGAAVNAEIINADSRLFYRGLDIGTAKPTQADRAAVTHHLIDILDPGDRFSLAEFLDAARAILTDIESRGRIPLLAGGTGQYVWALVEDWNVPRVPPDPLLRASLEHDAQVGGALALHAVLASADADAAARIDPRNVRRVVRALEVVRAGQRVPARPAGHSAASTGSMILGISAPREALYERADRRIDQMMSQGWLQEVRALMDAGVPVSSSAFSSIGYRALAAHVAGECSLDEAIGSIRSATRRLIRRQFNWFKGDDPRIRWIESGPSSSATAIEIVRGWI